MSIQLPADHGLTQNAESFLTYILDGDSVIDASAKAGFTHQHGYQVLKRAGVQRVIQEALQHTIVTQGAPKAYKELFKLLDANDSQLRMQASKLVLSLAGFVPTSGAPRINSDDKQLSEMSRDELHEVMGKRSAEIEKLEKELAARARPVDTPDSTPNAGRSADKGADYLE